MIDLTPEAKDRFDAYLLRVHKALRGSRAVTADEVEQNVREHVEIALATGPGAGGPVAADRLGMVLEQLGPPERWLPDEERPAWRRVMDRVMNGPEDWRLPYLSFGLTLLMIIAIPIGGIVLLLPAFLLSRATVALAAERGEDLGARRWLVLPPIVFALLIVAVLLLIAVPGGLGAMLLEDEGRTFGWHADSRQEQIRLGIGVVALAAGTWFIVLSGLVAMLMTPIRALFAPVLSGMRRAHALVLTIAGGVLLAIGSLLVWGL